MTMSDLYQEIILDHARAPHHAGLREPFDAQTYQVNPTCGDEVTLRVALGSSGGGAARIVDVSYSGMGCSISQASTSVMCDLVIGQGLDDVRALDDAFEAMIKSKGEDAGDEDLLGDAIAFAGVSRYANRVKCALLGWKALMDAMNQAVQARDAVASGGEIGDNENHE